MAGLYGPDPGALSAPHGRGMIADQTETDQTNTKHRGFIVLRIVSCCLGSAYTCRDAYLSPQLRGKINSK